VKGQGVDVETVHSVARPSETSPNKTVESIRRIAEVVATVVRIETAIWVVQ
jgi:hypothetical protein